MSVVAPALLLAAFASLPATLEFSWDTLPQFFHSQNASGPWSAAALAVISKYQLATFEKCHRGCNNGISIEERNAAACNAVNSASGGSTASVYYLNSLIDYAMFTPLADLLQSHPEYRLRDTAGHDIHVQGANVGYNLSVAAIRDAWVADCTAAIDAGCSACYIDKSNNLGQFGDMSAAQASMFYAAHRATLHTLNQQLAAKGAWAVSNNQGSASIGTTMSMLEDFSASEHCITTLQTLVARGIGVEAHAGDLPDGAVNAPGGGDDCAEGGVNAMSAFLIGAGNHSYYHCARKAEWQSDPKWPAPGHSDRWLDWLPAYDRKLGAPLAPGVKGADGVWRRAFAAGTRVVFDPVTRNGTITWGDGHVSRGPPTQSASKLSTGCDWISL